VNGRSAPWLGSLLLATAAVWLLSLLTLVVGQVLPQTWSTPPLLLLYLSVAASTLYAVARFGLWRLANGTQGASLLLWSAILGLAGALMPFAWLGPLWLEMDATVSGRVDASLTLAALILLSIGLPRARLVSVRVAAIGVGSAALRLVGLLFGPAVPIVWLLASAAQIAFLFAVAGSVFMRYPRAVAAEVPPASAL
jgi:hypothetical protein